MKKAFTLIELMIVIAIIAIIAAIAIPNLLEARKHGNEASAIGSMRTINASMAIYIERNPSQKYAGSLTDLETDGYVDNVLGSGEKQGFFFNINTATEYEYEAIADPAVLNQTGNRYFFTNQSGVIRFAHGAFAVDDSPAIGGK
jgi:type IV pilus assembly protein PilA